MSLPSSTLDFVKQMDSDFEKDYKDGNIDKLVKTYTEDAKIIGYDNQQWIGREQIRQYLQGDTKGNVQTISVQNQTIHRINDELFLELCHYQLDTDSTPKNGYTIWKKSSSTSGGGPEWLRHIDVIA
ncbi:unnamed protein product [Didymodactylos carnosus]|uniref:DUF4440 domain-containing protein n=1 Tax=Didymodactylos carnosus TaxID=1234261 RepID=A0A815NMG0_9BILA|nr:unnamed protein product [Didymodactylos carnosus]CAF4313930.1 unnamed protein product [Didymodactylos carnosus]